MIVAGHRTGLGMAAGLGAVCGWALHSLAGRQGLIDGFTPGQLGALRYLVPALCLAPLLAFGLWRRLCAIGFLKLTTLGLLAGPVCGFVVMHGLTLNVDRARRSDVVPRISPTRRSGRGAGRGRSSDGRDVLTPRAGREAALAHALGELRIAAPWVSRPTCLPRLRPSPPSGRA